jgi:hypothetical protein
MDGKLKQLKRRLTETVTAAGSVRSLLAGIATERPSSRLPQTELTELVWPANGLTTRGLPTA